MRIAAIVMVIFAFWISVAQTAPKRGAANVPPASLASLTKGITERQVEEVLKAQGDHQFTALLLSNTVRCVSYYRNDVYGKYYLVFTNNYLSAICESPAFEMRRVPYKGSWSNERVLGNPETRISKVLNATNMIGPALVAAFKPQTPPKRSVDPGLTSAFLLSQTASNGAKQAERQQIYSALLDQFDPMQIELGATLPNVEARLGEPAIIEALDAGDEVRYYGSVEYGLMGTRELMWLAVVYRQGKVIRVFSHDFLDTDKIRTLEEKLE